MSISASYADLELTIMSVGNTYELRLHLTRPAPVTPLTRGMAPPP